MVEKKVLNCVFWEDVVCAHRKSEKVKVMARCWSCREFKRFVREMDETDARMMDEIDRKRSEGGGSG